MLDTRRHQDRAPTTVRELMKMVCEGGVPTLMPVHVKVDLPRFIDVMQYFRYPTVMGPGKAARWGVHPNFDYHTGDLIRTMQTRGITVLPSDHWIDACDRVTPSALHSKQKRQNLATMTTQFCDA
eukprot:4580418-Pyramimonas_sp.AAC.1